MAGIEVPPVPEWDYEWTTSSGVYPSQDGWTKTIGTTGTASEALESGYYRMKAKTSNAYIQYQWPTVYDKGVLFVSFRITTTASCLRVYLGNATSSIGVRVNYTSTSSQRAIYLQDASTPSSGMTQIGSFTYNKTYNLQLEYDNGYGNVWWRNYTDGEDWALIASNVDCSTIINAPAGGGASIRYVALSSSQQSCTLYQTKMKFNRT